MADDVEGFLKDHGLADVTLIGHSMYAPTSTHSADKTTLFFAQADANLLQNPGVQRQP